MLRKVLFTLIGVGVAVALLIQLVPFGRDYTNPPVIAEPVWDSAETRALAQRSCFDCHSNETVYPWYSKVAPVSWLLARHIAEGREVMNLSEFDPQDFPDADEIAEVVLSGEMPMPQYLLQHPEARLTDAEKATLIEGFKRTLGEEGD